MSQDINNIDTYETRTKGNTTKQRLIYEVIDKDYIEDSYILPVDFIRERKKNQTQNLIYHTR